MQCRAIDALVALCICRAPKRDLYISANDSLSLLYAPNPLSGNMATVPPKRDVHERREDISSFY
jgi:hypothetical protein